MKKGFFETQAKFNKWITDVKKRIDGDDEDEDEDDEMHARPGNSQRQQYASPPPQQAPYGVRKSNDIARRSSDRDRYDPDPRALGDDFTTLELRDDDGASRLLLPYLPSFLFLR